MRAVHKVTTALTLVVATAFGGWRSSADWRASDADRGECTSAGEPTALLPDTLTDLRLRLNLPAYRLDVVEQGVVSRSIRVAVGQPKYRTPIGHFRIDYAVWNPWWRPPDSEWARQERPTAPGWSNPVGRVKLHVTGLVFLHGTPLERSLGSAASHACVRMSNADAVALARLIHEHAGPAVPAALLDALVADTSRTHTLVLSRAVPVDIEYALAEVQDAELFVYYDVYRYAGSRVPPAETQAIQALRRAGGDSAVIDLARLHTLVRAARRATVHLPLDSLIAPDAAVSLPPLARVR
jgi:murein L,D-transpeptidase YcbB/YkuD